MRADLRERRGVRRARRSRAGDRGGRARCRDDRRRRRDRGWRGRCRENEGGRGSRGEHERFGVGAAMGARGVRGIRRGARRGARAVDGRRFPRLHVGPVVIQQEGWRGADGGAQDWVPGRSHVRRLQREAHAGGEGHTHVQPGQLEGELPGALLERRGVHRRTGLDADQGRGADGDVPQEPVPVLPAVPHGERRDVRGGHVRRGVVAGHGPGNRGASQDAGDIRAQVRPTRRVIGG